MNKIFAFVTMTACLSAFANCNVDLDVKEFSFYNGLHCAGICGMHDWRMKRTVRVREKKFRQDVKKELSNHGFVLSEINSNKNYVLTIANDRFEWGYGHGDELIYNVVLTNPDGEIVDKSGGFVLDFPLGEYRNTVRKVMNAIDELDANCTSR